MSNAPRKLVIHWPRLGPYHLARLRGAHEWFMGEGAQVVALEIAGLDRTYGWKKEEGVTPFARVTVFPDSYYDDLKEPELERGIFQQLDAINPEAVAINGYAFPDSRVCLRWCRARGRKAILMTETTSADKTRRILRELAKKVLLRRFSVAVCGGELHRDYLLSLGMPSHRIFTKYDVVDNDYFATPVQFQGAENPLPGLSETRPFFLASSRFIPRKNFACLIEAFGNYRATTPAKDGWRLVLLGSGDEENTLRAQVEKERIPDVTFAGFRQIEDLPSYYQRAGCFIHPALAEPWGLVVNEAMAAGLPVIVSRNVGCARDLVEQGMNGYVFDPASRTELAEAMGEISGNEELRQAMGRRSRQIIREWTPRHFAESMWKAFDVPDEPYRLVRFGGRKLIGYRDDLRHRKMSRTRRIETFTLRRRVAMGLVRAAIGSHLDRFWFRKVTLDDPEFLSPGITRVLAYVRQELKQQEVDYVFTWPAEITRERTYAYVLEKGSGACTFVKFAKAEEAPPLAHGFAMLEGLRDAARGRFRFPRPLILGTLGDVCFHVTECVPVGRRAPRARAAFVDPTECIESYAGPAVFLSEEQLGYKLWMQEFWRVIGRSTKFARCIESDQTFGATCRRVHGDLTIANLIVTGSEVWVLDWELSDQAGPHLTDHVTFFLGQQQRLLNRRPAAVLDQFLERFIRTEPPKEQRAARLSLAYLYAVGSGLGRSLVKAWNEAPNAE